MAFWGLDAYYLRQERLFRKLYDDVCRSSEEQLLKDPFCLSAQKYEAAVPTLAVTLWTPSILAVHAPVVLAVVIALVVLSAR
jgi:hypothetical protein